LGQKRQLFRQLKKSLHQSQPFSQLFKYTPPSPHYVTE
jgi:hypothetical protein